MAAQTVSIPWPKEYLKDILHQYEASKFGIEVKNWLIEQGLLMYVDFEWRLNITNQSIDVTFFKDTTLSTFIVLKFQG